MSHGKRESILQNSRARDVQYWKKKGFLKKCFGVMSDKHYRAGVNKKTIRFHKAKLGACFHNIDRNILET